MEPLSPQTIGCLLLDVDGTLVDTETLHFETWCGAFEEHGLAFSLESFHRLFGLDPKATVMSLLGCTADDARILAGRKAELFRKRSSEIRAFPGAVALLSNARRFGLATALISSTSRRDVEELLLPSIGGPGIVDLIATSDMVPRGKPEPDLFYLAMKKLNSEPRKALAAGDTAFDVVAGKRANVSVVGISGNTEQRRILRAEGACRVVENLFDLSDLVNQWVRLGFNLVPSGEIGL